MKKIYEPAKGRHITIDTTLDPEKNAKLVSTKILNSIYRKQLFCINLVKAFCY